MTVRIEGMQATISELGDNLRTVVIGTAYEAASLMQELTPIDTGFAMNSWIVTLDRDDFGTPGMNAIDARMGAVTSMQLGQTLYINNGAEYIKKLEHGHSRQAPQGMVAVVMPAIPHIVEDQLKDAEKAGG